MKYFLGVDAGNTKTVALIADRFGKIIGSGRGACGDIYNAGSATQALQNVDDAVQQALKQANCSQSDLFACTFSMAGADWPEDFELIREGLKARGYRNSIEVVNDAVGALRAGAVDDWGVAIVAGTGAAIGARSRDGQMWHSSWWQEGGGGRSLGEQALRAVYRSTLGLTAPTALTESLLGFYGMSSVEALLHSFTRREGRSQCNTPDLARLVLDVAEGGDEAAQAIVSNEARILAEYALVAARKVGIAGGSFPLILAGSVFKHQSPLLIDAVLEYLASFTSEPVTVIRSKLEPCVGALIVSLEAGGVSVKSKVRACLARTAPPKEFFTT